MDNLNPENLTAEKSIKKAEEMQGRSVLEYEDSHFNPAKNDKVISIVEQADGNFKIYGQRNGKMIEIREGKPQDALEVFLTYD